MKKIIFSLLAIILCYSSFAQDDRKLNKKEERRQRISAITRQEEEGVIKYRRHLAIGGKLTTDGYGGFIEVGRAQSINRGLLFQLDISEKKHPKEEKQQIEFTQSVPLSYGKLNFLYPIKLGAQQQIVFANKGNKNGVSVTANVGGGLIVGILRPYMIDVDNNGVRGYISYEDDSTAFLNPAGYIRGPSFGSGWNRSKIRPGLYLKPALRFDYGKYNEVVNAIEVGITTEYFSKPIQQMIYQKNERFFFSGFIAIVFGRRK